MSLYRTPYLPAAIALVFLISCNPPGTGTHDVPPGEAYRSLTGDGAWCWFSDPRAVYYEGSHRRTYAGWVDSTGNIVVGYYDHETESIATHIVHAQFEKDDHDNPSFFMDADGKMMVFYSKHGTGQSPIHLAKASQAE